MTKNTFGSKDFYINIIKNNHLYIVWFLVYFTMSVAFLGGKFISFLLTLILYIISLSIALSPLGEKILRFFEKVRPLYTKEEKEYLIPIFEEVYNEAKKIVPNLHKIEICIIDTMTVNACALGRNTIAVTKGAVETFSAEELKALIAHELAHIINGDTIATLLNIIGNGVFTAFVLTSKGILYLVDLFQNSNGFSKVITTIIKAIFTLWVFSTVFIGNLIISINSRKNEYRADKFAFKLLYGEDMVGALYLLQKISLGENRSTIARLTASHPHIAKRIEKLEILIDTEE